MYDSGRRELSSKSIPCKTLKKTKNLRKNSLLFTKTLKLTAQQPADAQPATSTLVAHSLLISILRMLAFMEHKRERAHLTTL